MSPLIRPTAELAFDVADVNGRINQWGFGYDWMFKAERQERPSGREAFEPIWEMNNCQIIPGLDLLALQGNLPVRDMDLAFWSFTHGENYWALERPDSYPRALWLSYKRSEPDTKGLAVSNVSVAPRFGVHLIDFVPPPNQTEQVFTAIELRSIGDDVNYRLELPLHSETKKYPELYYSEGAVDDNTDWILRDRLERTDYASSARDTRILRRSVSFEETDGCILITFSGISEPWIFRPRALERPTAGFVAVEFKGHAGMLNSVDIEYPTSGWARPYERKEWPIVINPTTSYKWSESFYSNGTVTVLEDTEIVDGSWESRPVITLTRTDKYNRPLVSVVHEIHDATLTDPRSDPKSTQTQATAMAAIGKDPAELQSLTYRRFLRRGWSFSATLRDPHRIWGAYLKPNMQVAISAGWSGSHNAIMVGYIERPKVDRQARREQGITPVYTIKGVDFIGARMQAKKFMLWPCSPLSDGPPTRTAGQWYLDEWGQWWLTRCGFGGTFTCPTGIEVKAIDQEGAKELPWDFDQRTEVVKGLDQVFKAHGLTPLGVDANGDLYTEDDVGYTAPPDFELNEATATGDDVIELVHMDVEDKDFRNLVAAIDRDRNVWAAWDEDSTSTPGDDYYIGDQWMQVISADDGSDPGAQADQRLTEAMRTRRLVKWTRNLKTDLPPGSWVNVNIDDIGIAANTVMRVIQDEGRLTAGDLNAKSVFLCELQAEVAP
jgi:hypothetical protein